MSTLRVSKEGLRNRTEFNFDSGDAANLEAGIGVLRVIQALQIAGFTKIALIKPTKNKQGADLVCEKGGQKICLEVKTVTKQSMPRSGRFLEEQLYEKILENISKARIQLQQSAQELGCSVKIFVCVLNWFDQSIYLMQSDYQEIVNKLERDQDQASLDGIDGVLIVTKMGERYLFLNETGKSIDR